MLYWKMSVDVFQMQFEACGHDENKTVSGEESS